MDRKIKSGSTVSEKLIAPFAPEGMDAAASLPRDEASGMSIDFHSAEFNRTDDLNDYSGNYRFFQPLDGVVTADMRHQMERREHRDALDSRDDIAATVKKIEIKSDGAQAGETAPPLTIVSPGRTLIVAQDAERAIACGEILSGQGLTCMLLAIKEASPYAAFSRLGDLPVLEVNAASITGAFGGFSATVTTEGKKKDLTEWFDKDAIAFDLVLDLQPTPSFAGDRLPMGYYAPGADLARLDEAMRELPEMRGRFHKPQFNAFLGDRCIHGRSRTRDCSRCVAVCPFGAVQATVRSISINHYLCQGCGGCALVCPTEAIRRVQPSTEELLNMLSDKLKNRSEGDGYPPALVISGGETPDGNSRMGTGEKTADGPVRLEVEQIGHVGLELLLAAVASGAGGVIVVCGPQDPPTIRKAVEWQVRMAGAIVQGLGMPEDKIRFAVVPPENSDIPYAGFPAVGPAALPGDSSLPAFSPVPDRRMLIRLATEHLADRCGAQQPWLPLPAGSPFGGVTVDSGACTLCMACAVACPSGALFARGDLPRLEFLEARCHQCGLCEETCPEGALGLLPRMLCDHRAGEMSAVLHEVEPFRCVECGVPFATRAMIDRMKDKLVGHWMYADDRQLRRLQMCGTCRTRDALGSQDMKSWNNS